MKLPASFLLGVLLTAGPVSAQWVQSFEETLEGWQPNPDAQRPVAVDQATVGATHGTHSLAISQTGGGWAFAARGTFDGGTPGAMAFQEAVAEGLDKYLLAFDLTIDPAALPASTQWFQVNMALNSDAALGGGFQTQEKIVAWSGNRAAPETRRVRWPLRNFRLATSGWYQIFMGFNSNYAVSETATIYVDNLRLIRIGGLEETVLFSFEDGTVDPWLPEGTTPFLTMESVAAGATHGTRAMQVTFGQSGWTAGAAARDIPLALDHDPLMLAVDITIPADSPGINQIYAVLQEPDAGTWHQNDQWIGGTAGNRYTLLVPFIRTGTGPVNFFLGRATTGDQGTRRALIDNIRIISARSFAARPFEITRVESVGGRDVRLTWLSEPDTIYLVRISNDLQSWIFDVDDNVPSGGDETTYQFPLPADWREVFIRVEKSRRL